MKKFYVVTRDCTMSCGVEAQSAEAAIELAGKEGIWEVDDNYYDDSDCYITSDENDPGNFIDAALDEYEDAMAEAMDEREREMKDE